MVSLSNLIESSRTQGISCIMITGYPSREADCLLQLLYKAQEDEDPCSSLMVAVSSEDCDRYRDEYMFQMVSVFTRSLERRPWNLSKLETLFICGAHNLYSTEFHSMMETWTKSINQVESAPSKPRSRLVVMSCIARPGCVGCSREKTLIDEMQVGFKSLFGGSSMLLRVEPSAIRDPARRAQQLASFKEDMSKCQNGMSQGLRATLDYTVSQIERISVHGDQLRKFKIDRTGASDILDEDQEDQDDAMKAATAVLHELTQTIVVVKSLKSSIDILRIPSPVDCSLVRLNTHVEMVESQCLIRPLKKGDQIQHYSISSQLQANIELFKTNFNAANIESVTDDNLDRLARFVGFVLTFIPGSQHKMSPKQRGNRGKSYEAGSKSPSFWTRQWSDVQEVIGAIKLDISTSEESWLTPSPPIVVFCSAPGDPDRVHLINMHLTTRLLQDSFKVYSREVSWSNEAHHWNIVSSRSNEESASETGGALRSLDALIKIAMPRVLKLKVGTPVLVVEHLQTTQSDSNLAPNVSIGPGDLGLVVGFDESNGGIPIVSFKIKQKWEHIPIHFTRVIHVIRGVGTVTITQLPLQYASLVTYQTAESIGLRSSAFISAQDAALHRVHAKHFSARPCHFQAYNDAIVKATFPLHKNFLSQSDYPVHSLSIAC